MFDRALNMPLQMYQKVTDMTATFTFYKTPTKTIQKCKIP